jgi:ATP-dependent exoDNAse (exonuclease V) beta subunit
LSVTELESALEEMEGSGVPSGAADFASPMMPFPRLSQESGKAEEGETGDGSDFGLVCHALLEAKYKGLDDFSLLREESLGATSPARLEGMKAAARELAARFVDSELGREIANCPRVETEKEFMLALPGGFLAKGRMDLFARSGDRIIVVDFKTHRMASPGAFALQLWLYRRAAELIYPDAKVETWLAWLRGPDATCPETAFADDYLEKIARQASARAAKAGRVG